MLLPCLRSAAAAVIPARGKAVVPTDLAIACPPGTYARIAPRSGLAVKHFIDTGDDVDCSPASTLAVQATSRWFGAGLLYLISTLSSTRVITQLGNNTGC